MGRPSRRSDVPAAIVDFGGVGNTIYVHGDRETYGIPTVELRGFVFGSCSEGFTAWPMLPEAADKLADALKLAARMARGESIPTALDELLNKRRA